MKICSSLIRNDDVKFWDFIGNGFGEKTGAGFCVASVGKENESKFLFDIDKLKSVF